jgi:hypothetical protein
VNVNKRPTLAWMAVLAVLIIACGGNSGPLAYNFTSTKLRAYKVGDLFEYKYWIENSNPPSDTTYNFFFRLNGSQPEIVYKSYPFGWAQPTQATGIYKFSQSTSGVQFSSYSGTTHSFLWPDDATVAWQENMPGPAVITGWRPIAGPLFPLLRSIQNHFYLEVSYAGMESVTVPAGTFNAEKLTVIYHDIGPDPTRQTTIWLVPSISAAVKVRDEYFDGRPAQVVELQSYINQP